MKILLYAEGLHTIGKSGLGKAIEHQSAALEHEHIEYTLDSKEDYDILHINTWFLKSYLIAKRAKRQGKKVVYHAHSTEEDYRDGFIFANQTSKFIKWWLIRCYQLGDIIITPTEYSKRLLSSYHGLEDKKIYAISNGIDTNYFHHDAAYGADFRKAYGYTEHDVVIVGIGLYMKRKGILDFVELARRMPEYCFIWFGESPLKAAPSSVRKAVKTQLENLTFAGYVEKNRIRDALNGCDLYLFPTLEETEGIPILEAMACRTPSLIRDIGVFEDFLQNNLNMYKAKNIDEFEIKIRQIINGELPDLTEQYQNVVNERDIRNVGKKLRTVYEHLLYDGSGMKQEL